MRPSVNQRMGDRLGGDERVGHHAPEKVALAAYAEARGSFARHGIARNKVERRRVLNQRVVFAFVGEVPERGQPPRDLPAGMGFVPIALGCGAERIRHNDAAWTHRQSMVAPDSFASRAQNLESSARNAANSSGDRESATSVPSRANVSLTSGWPIATVVASNSFLTMSGGVPNGTKNPYQNDMLYWGRPTSVMPGISGINDERSRLVTASA